MSKKVYLVTYSNSADGITDSKVCRTIETAKNIFAETKEELLCMLAEECWTNIIRTNTGSCFDVEIVSSNLVITIELTDSVLVD